MCAPCNVVDLGSGLGPLLTRLLPVLSPCQDAWYFQPWGGDLQQQVPDSLWLIRPPSHIAGQGGELKAGRASKQAILLPALHRGCLIATAYDYRGRFRMTQTLQLPRVLCILDKAHVD